MKQFVLSMALLFTSQLLAVSPERLAAIHDEHIPHYHEIHTHQLNEWIDGGKSLTILDARTPQYDDGHRLPGASFFPYTNSDKQIGDTLPLKDQTIIVYCTSLECPASKFLADRLVALGYTNVYKYPEGIKAWIAAGNRLEKAGP